MLLRIVIHFPTVGKRAVVEIEVAPTALEPAQHVGPRDVVPALPDAGGDAAQRQSWRRQAQENNLYAVARRFPASEAVEIDHPAQGRLEGEVSAGAGVAVEFGEEKPAAGERGQIRAQGESPPAMRSAFTKCRTPAPVGRYSRAKVVLPAPFGPAMTMQRGVLAGRRGFVEVS